MCVRAYVHWYVCVYVCVCVCVCVCVMAQIMKMHDYDITNEINCRLNSRIAFFSDCCNTISPRNPGDSTHTKMVLLAETSGAISAERIHTSTIAASAQGWIYMFISLFLNFSF